MLGTDKMNRRLFLGAIYLPLIATPAQAGFWWSQRRSGALGRDKARIAESARRRALKPHQKAHEEAVTMWVTIQELARQRQTSEKVSGWVNSEFPFIFALAFLGTAVILGALKRDS
jgi:hypothetical protein